MRVGVVIAARNAAPWIGDAITSVRAQVYRNWLLSVVDDGSDDATAEQAIAWAGADPRITVLRQARGGASAARNRGAASVHGCAGMLFLDADDWLAPHALRRLTEAMGAVPAAVAAAGACAFVGEQDGPGCWPRRLLYPPSGDILPDLIAANRFANCGHVLIRAETLDKVGLFRTGLAYGEDWELLVRLATRGPFATLSPSEAPILFVRRRASGAFLSQAATLDAAAPCLAVIFTDPAVVARFPPDRLLRLRARAEATGLCNAGRALLANGHPLAGWVMLGRGLLRRHAPPSRRGGVTDGASQPRVRRSA